MKMSRGIVEDDLVQLDSFYFLVNFIVLDTYHVAHPATQILVILGRPFMKTFKFIINYKNGVMKLAFGNMNLMLNV